ncbi:unnamed protein product [Clonostachys rosea]|uniref:Enoyl reductase (ER) domain-containing protein n=1 Tax=Bionectria ochroleuca TaxID=29856 RepID=A0ABY6UTB4_BIOOC|nr:unnamed protein product [Clonostachys rosea]
MPSTMKAWQFTSVQSTLPEALTLNESAAKPSSSTLAKDQILVEVITAAINPVEYKLPETPVLGKLMVHSPTTPGLDFCGRVVAKHPSNDTVSEGQLVFGGLDIGTKIPKFGTLAQITVASSLGCAPLPEGLNYDDAAAIGTAAMTALQSLPPELVKPGAKVFINGGSGGVGTYTVQFARALGAEVTTSSSTANLELCRSLGATDVMDYKKSNILAELEKRGQIFDVVVDNVGGDNGLYQHSPKFLNQAGLFVQVGVQESIWSSVYRVLTPGWLAGGKRQYRMVRLKNRREDYERIGQWIVEGKVKPVIDDRFDFRDVPKAYEKLRLGRARGKIVVRIGQDSN